MVLLTEEKKQHIRELRRKAMKLPLHPGVYIMHDKDGTIIYIGKAKALKNRVSQYFGSEKNHDEKVRRMVSNVEYFEYILTDSEFEALILESSLIKQHQPKYNILLKDDKGYSYIKVTAGDWPRISETKQVLDDGAKYIGPYLSAWTIKDTVEEARKIFRLPSCSRKFPQDFGKGRPCLNYYIKQCSAPCRGNVSREEYQEAVQEALDFIRGGASDSVRALTAKMNEAAENMEFELAARIRDRIAAINKLKERLTPGQWPELRERILAGQTLYGDLQEELLEQEGLYEQLMDRVAALESLPTLDRWEDVLRSRFPERMRDTYIQCLEAQMCLAGDRKQYAAVIAYLKKLRTYPGGRDTELARRWRTAYPRRRSMLDELGKAGY